MRKLAVVLLILLVSTGAMAQKNIVVWSVWAQEWTNVFQEFTDEYFTPQTGIQVDLEVLPWSGFEQRYLLAAATGEGPDIGMTGSLGPADLGIRGAVVNMAAAFGDDFKTLTNQLFPGLMRSVEFNGAVFGVPMSFGTYPMFYRTDIMENLGLALPQTWDEVRTMIPMLQARNMNFSVCLGAISPQDFSMFLWQHGEDWYSPDRTKSGLDTPGAIKAFNEYVQLFTRYGLPKDVQPAFQTFKSGDIPIQIGRTYDYANLQVAAPELRGRWATSLVPGTPQADGTLNKAAYVGGMNFMMFETSKEKDAAFQWIQWFLSEETQSAISVEIMNRIPGAMFLPANYQAMMSLPIPDEHKRVFRDQGLAGVAPAYALSPETVTHRFIQNAISQAVLNGMNPEQAIREGATQMNSELNRKQAEFRRFIQRM